MNIARYSEIEQPLSARQKTLSTVLVYTNANYMSLFAMELEKLLVNDNIRGSSKANLFPKHYIKRNKLRKGTLKNC